MSTIYSLFELLGRILIAFMFLQSGVGKMLGYTATSHYMAAKGVPPLLLPVVILLEIVGSVAIIL